LYGWKVRRNESLVNTDELEFALFERDDRERVCCDTALMVGGLCAHRYQEEK
jgi:hypothetical protein